MTVHTTTRRLKCLLTLGTASVFSAAAAADAAATDARDTAMAVAVTIETGLVASSATRLDHGRPTFVIRNASRSRH